MDRVEWPKVFIIVLNWNGWEDTIECLESLYDISYPNYNVVVVDNDSQDDSLVRISAYARGEEIVESAPLPYNCRIEPLRVTNYTRREAEDLQATTLSKKLVRKGRNNASDGSLVIIQNEQNFGYPEGNNVGIRYALKASADYVLILNNDTVVDKNFLTELVRAADEDVSIGVIGPKIYWYDAPNVIQTTGARIDFWTGRIISLNSGKRDDEIEHLAVNKLMPADYMPGACFLIKRKVIEEVGKLDPTYFLYGEELDWCVRISRAGYRIVCDLNSKIWHKKTASTSKVKRFTGYYPHRNLVINIRKYARGPQFVSFLLLYPAYWIVILLKAREFGSIRHFVRGFIDGLLTPITSQPAFYDDESA
jgi:GT2 family glycosyltransferase